MSFQAPRAQLKDVPTESPHYVRAVTEMGDSRDVTVAEDIYAANGMKLVTKGTKITQHHFERLTQHILKIPLDQSLIADSPVTPAGLARLVEKVIESEPLYRRIVTRAGDPIGLRNAMADIKLCHPLSMRLTVMQDKRHEIFIHSVRTAIIAYAIAQRINLGGSERQAIMLAGLFHDVGEMHTDPALLAAGHDITPAERRFVLVHPVTGYVLVKEMPNFPPAASLAILNHHERMDGSGYPNALPGAKISHLAKLVGLADVAEAVSMRFELARLEMLLRINQTRFDPALLAALRDLTQANKHEGPMSAQIQGTANQLHNLAEVMQTWFDLRTMLANAPSDSSPFGFLNERMATIRSLVLQAGFDPDHMDSMLAIARDDPEILLELHEMMDEMEWLMKDLANEIDRRSAELAGLSPGALKGLQEQLRAGHA